MRENAVRNVTYIVVMCAEIRYNPLNVGNCAQKCGKFPRKGRALCGKMREHPSFPQQNVQWTMRKSAVRIAFSSRQEVPWSGSNPRIVRKSAGAASWRTMRKSAVKYWVLPGQDVPRLDGILWNVRKSAVKTEFYRAGRSETKRNPTKCAEKCGKKLSFTVSGRSETKRNSAKCAQKCGKNCVLLG